MAPAAAQLIADADTLPGTGARGKTLSLAVVMTHPTQFDGPLFARIGCAGPFDLTVYYLETGKIADKIDPELGFSPGWDIPVSEDYHFRTCPSGLGRPLRFLWRECFAKANYDLVILPGYRHLGILLLAALRPSQAVGMRLDSVLLYREPAWKARLKRLVLKRLFGRFATFHPVGSLTERLLHQYGVSPARIFRFPYAADNGYLWAAAQRFCAQRDGLRAELGISAAAFVVLGVLKFVPRENPMELLRAFLLLHRKMPGSALILVGAGPLRRELESYIAANELTGVVQLVGYANYSSLPRWYAVSDVFVHPAQRECWGVSVNEAMACGLPVITSDKVGSSYDLVVDGANGFRYPSGDCAALAACLETIASRPDRGRALGECSRRRIAPWNYEASVASLQAALQVAASGPAARQLSGSHRKR